MNIKIDPGLVFAIPLAEKTFGFGQLIAWQHPIFYMVGYDIRAGAPTVDEHDIKQARPVFMGNFFDVLIRNGRWLTIKKLATPKVPFPCFKIKIGDKFFVENWDRQQMRVATVEECTTLQFRSNHGPIILENALKAYFGLRPWEPLFDSLTADAVRMNSNIGRVMPIRRLPFLILFVSLLLTKFSASAITRPTGYGAVPGYRPLALGSGASISLSSAWRGRWVDITGYPDNSEFNYA